MAKRRPERFPVCEYLRDELEARGWSVETFCERTGLRRDVAEELLAGSRSITKLTALCLEHGLGCRAATWLRLQEAGKPAGGK